MTSAPRCLVVLAALASCSGEQVSLGSDVGPPPYQPCAGRSCGQPCDPCDPTSDGGCPPPPMGMACDAQSACVPGGGQSCPPYNPCAGKVCNEGCLLCDPADPMCMEPPQPSVCDPTGTCAAGPFMCP